MIGAIIYLLCAVSCLCVAIPNIYDVKVAVPCLSCVALMINAATEEIKKMQRTKTTNKVWRKDE